MANRYRELEYFFDDNIPKEVLDHAVLRLLPNLDDFDDLSKYLEDVDYDDLCEDEDY